ncbi:radical SAM protein [Thermanaeromonas sp. C210]|uniref:radical SAM protein n=1 Tax=Thermanaeromonas sp. C210 TaxID=2731925 RepID=UPI00155B9EF2|nr:radical SAM protein [Thermanaeromonas sp. C210]GFN23492.1 radical SAM protein [Thermanaeromonas sp. C210]
MLRKEILYLVDKAKSGELLNREEMAMLFEIDPFTPESAYIRYASREISSKVSNNTAEVHAQVGINVGCCARNCKWCSFAAASKVFGRMSVMSTEEIVRRCRQAEEQGANAVYLMATGAFPFGHLLEIIREVRRALTPDAVLIGNVDDFTVKEAYALKDAGLDGVYHALRLREGKDSSIEPARRMATMRAAREAGLALGTCVEPVGPEHTTEELVEATIVARECGAVYSGCMRRVAVPGTELGERGMITEARQAHLLAVIRLATQQEIVGMCWHEPSTLGPLVGVNVMWAETGSNPRDTHEDCERTRGRSVGEVKRMYWEAGWRVLEGPSVIWRPKAGGLQKKVV